MFKLSKHFIIFFWNLLLPVFLIYINTWGYAKEYNLERPAVQSPPEGKWWLYDLKHMQAPIPVNQGLPPCVLEFYSWVFRTRPSQGGRFQSLNLPHKSSNFSFIYCGSAKDFI